LWIPLQGVGHAILHPGSTVATDVSAARAGTAAAIRYTPWVSGLLGNQHAAVRPRFDVDALQRRLAGDDLVDGRYRTITAWLGQALHDLTSDHRLEIVWQQLTDHTVSPNIESIARAIGTSSRTLRRLIHRASHCTFRTARELERLRSACRLLRAEIDLPWARASCQAGYCDQSHLCRAFRRWVGMPPGRFFGEGHHHLNDVFARRVHTTVAGYAVVAVGHPELRPLTPPHSLMREKRNSSARPRPV
jgi:AraC-like DNA-binding protein